MSEKAYLIQKPLIQGVSYINAGKGLRKLGAGGCLFVCFPCKLSPSALSPAPGRLGEAVQAEHCPPEIGAHPRPPEPLGKRRASSGGPRAGPAGRWHCKQGELCRSTPRVAGVAEAKESFYLYFPFLPLRPAGKILLLSPVMAASSPLISISFVPSEACC